jgi:hypothetical protein
VWIFVCDVGDNINVLVYFRNIEPLDFVWQSNKIDSIVEAVLAVDSYASRVVGWPALGICLVPASPAWEEQPEDKNPCSDKGYGEMREEHEAAHWLCCARKVQILRGTYWVVVMLWLCSILTKLRLRCMPASVIWEFEIWNWYLFMLAWCWLFLIRHIQRSCLACICSRWVHGCTHLSYMIFLAVSRMTSCLWVLEINTCTCNWWNQKESVLCTKESAEASQQSLGEFLVSPLNRKTEMTCACGLGFFVWLI